MVVKSRSPFMASKYVVLHALELIIKGYNDSSCIQHCSASFT